MDRWALPITNAYAIKYGHALGATFHGRGVWMERKGLSESDLGSQFSSDGSITSWAAVAVQDEGNEIHVYHFTTSSTLLYYLL